MKQERSLSKGARAVRWLGVLALMAVLGCSDIVGDQMFIHVLGSADFVAPENVERITIKAEPLRTPEVMGFFDQRGEPESPHPALNVWQVTLESDGKVEFQGVELACLGGDTSPDYDCMVEDGTSVPFGVAPDDPFIDFWLSDVLGMRLHRVSVDPQLEFRGGVFAPFDAATCTEVGIAGSLDPWPLEAEAACDTVFRTPTGSWVCMGELVDIQCDR